MEEFPFNVAIITVSLFFVANYLGRIAETLRSIERKMK